MQHINVHKVVTVLSRMTVTLIKRNMRSDKGLTNYNDFLLTLTIVGRYCKIQHVEWFTNINALCAFCRPCEKSNIKVL
jgi:hypothetical protein